MGKQFGFSMDNEDHEKFLQKIQEKGKAYLINYKKLIQVTTLFQTDWVIIYLEHSECESIIHSFESGEFYSKLPIEISNTFVKEEQKFIQRGRIYYEKSYYEGENLVYKDERLDEWYKELVKWIKKNLRCVEIEEYGKKRKEYVSESLLHYIQEGYGFYG